METYFVTVIIQKHRLWEPLDYLGLYRKLISFKHRVLRFCWLFNGMKISETKKNLVHMGLFLHCFPLDYRNKEARNRNKEARNKVNKLYTLCSKSYS